MVSVSVVTDFTNLTLRFGGLALQTLSAEMFFFPAMYHPVHNFKHTNDSTLLLFTISHILGQDTVSQNKAKSLLHPLPGAVWQYDEG